VRREKPGPLTAVVSLENGIAMVVGGNIIKGLLNYLTIINKAPEEERRGLTIDLAGIVLGTLGVIGVIAKKVDNFV
jgi:translation elongation factor EF-Tu-like GTPase